MKAVTKTGSARRCAWSLPLRCPQGCPHERRKPACKFSEYRHGACRRGRRAGESGLNIEQTSSPASGGSRHKPSRRELPYAKGLTRRETGAQSHGALQGRPGCRDSSSESKGNPWIGKTSPSPSASPPSLVRCALDSATLQPTPPTIRPFQSGRGPTSVRSTASCAVTLTLPSLCARLQSSTFRRGRFRSADRGIRSERRRRCGRCRPEPPGRLLVTILEPVRRVEPDDGSCHRCDRRGQASVFDPDRRHSAPSASSRTSPSSSWRPSSVP